MSYLAQEFQGMSRCFYWSQPRCCLRKTNVSWRHPTESFGLDLHEVVATPPPISNNWPRESNISRCWEVWYLSVVPVHLIQVADLTRQIELHSWYCVNLGNTKHETDQCWRWSWARQSNTLCTIDRFEKCWRQGRKEPSVCKFTTASPSCSWSLDLEKKYYWKKA